MSTPEATIYHAFIDGRIDKPTHRRLLEAVKDGEPPCSICGFAPCETPGGCMADANWEARD